LAKPGVLSRVHGQVDTSSQESCRRCHRPGNRVGAAAMVLPAKGIACMPCHAATWSRGDDFSFAGLIIFGLGLLGALTFWFSGATGGLLAAERPQSLGSKLCDAASQTLRAIFSRRILAILKALLLDGFLQRRLWRLSPLRGLIHNLIFLPFTLRFFWGLVALIATENAPGAAWPWLLVNKNAPLTALVFDISGLLVLLGAAAAMARRLAATGDDRRPGGLPRPDWLAMGLLAAIVLVGFVLEAMRIALTGAPPGAAWAFVGYALSGLFGSGAGSAAAYGYIWYIHAILTGAFVAYLPFSRMFHIILAPVVLAAGAVVETEHQQH
jgi:nitrate reductase gamma subunit